MGLAGYNDRDRNINDTMNTELASAYGMSYIKKERLKDVKVDRQQKETYHMWRAWGFPNADIVKIRSTINEFLKSLSYVKRLYYIVEPDIEGISVVKKCYEQLLRCVAYENGIDKIIELSKNDLHFFTSIYYQYVKTKELTQKKACLVIECYLSCRVKGIKELNDDDIIILAYEGKRSVLEKKYEEISSDIQRNVEFLRLINSTAEVEKIDVKVILEDIESEIDQKKEGLMEIERELNEIKAQMEEKREKYMEVANLLLYGTRNIE